MKISENIGKWSKRIWSFFAALSIIFGVTVGYQEFFGGEPNIFSEITSEINVFDINKPLKDLQINFQGENIQQKSLNLRIYRVKIKNVGATNITQNDFDQNDNWGIRVEGGRVIETRLLDSNSKYIESNVSPSVNNALVQFNKIIFDKGDYFNVELLVLHDKDIPPILYRTGKIAGIDENGSKISIAEYNQPFFETLFYGNLFVNIIRFLFYFVFSIAVFIAFILIVVKLQEKRTILEQRPKSPEQPE